MKCKIDNLITDDGRKYNSFYCCEDTIKGWRDEWIESSDGDGQTYCVIIDYQGCFYMLRVIRYQMAGFTDLSEKWESNKNTTVELIPVEKREITKTEWVEL